MPQATLAITTPGLTARVHLSLSVKGLQNLDVGSLSDPFVVSVPPPRLFSPAARDLFGWDLSFYPTLQNLLISLSCLVCGRRESLV